jgi:hypothetical protein
MIFIFIFLISTTKQKSTESSQIPERGNNREEEQKNGNERAEESKESSNEQQSASVTVRTLL